MKQYKRIMIGIIIIWVILSVFSAMWIYHGSVKTQGKYYMVEINRIQALLNRQKTFCEINLSNLEYIKQIDYLPAYESDVLLSELDDYFNGKEIAILGISAVPKRCEYHITPFIISTALYGYIRYSYNINNNRIYIQNIIIVEIILFTVFILIFSLLLYLINNLLKPFHEISELPYELSKGHLSKGIKETKNRYFGKFIWGLELLRVSLEEHRQREFQLAKDKKLMILSITHDIKTPLSTIKLYSKALYANLYDEEEKRRNTAKKIEEKANQVDKIVTEIIKASSSELIGYEIVMGEFYLKALISNFERAYSEKLDLLKIQFFIDHYTDKILKGDIDKLSEVFDNIIQNAIKYGDGKKIIISFEEEDNCQLIRIKNSGIPITSFNLHHMFECLWRGENAIGKPGNGLGLCICKQIIHKMDGEIYAETHENGMSIVVVLQKG